MRSQALLAGLLVAAAWLPHSPGQNAPPSTAGQAPSQSDPPQTVQSQAAPPAAPKQESRPTPSTGNAPAASQGPQKNADGTYTIRTNARLVILDVVVTDRKGELVRGLTRDDFTVTEAGETQAVQNFESTDAHQTTGDLTIHSTAELDKLAPRAPVNILLLDEFNTRFEDMAFARYSLKKFLEKQPDKLTTPTMLLAVSLQKFEVLRDYTQNKQELIDSLDHHFAAYPWQVHQYSWVGERYSTAFGTLERVAEATVGHQGHKNMIWIGRGFPPLDPRLVPIDAQQRVESVVQHCVNMLRDARVTLYSIDPAGVIANPSAYGSAAAFNDPFGGNYEFDKLAQATGGRALYGRNDVDAEIGTTVREGESFYTLTYRPTDTSLDPQKFRKIKVTVKGRPELSAVTRVGYYLQRNRRENPTNPSRQFLFDLASAENSTMVYDGLPLTVERSKTDPTGYVIHLEPRGIAWYYATDAEPRHAEFVVMVTTFDKKGKELKRDAHSLKVKATGDVPATGRLDQAINLPWKVEPDAKAVRARFVVRMQPSGRIGTADLPLEAK